MTTVDPTARLCSACGQRAERYDGTYYEPALCSPCWKARMDAPAPERPHMIQPDEARVAFGRFDEAAARASLTPLPEPREDLIETIDRSRAVMRILETLHEELTRLEIIPSQDADDVNALSSAKGYVARARNVLRGRFA